MPHQDTDAETPRAGHHVHFTLTIQSSRCDFTQEGCAKAVKPRLVQVPGQPRFVAGTGFGDAAESGRWNRTAACPCRPGRAADRPAPRPAGRTPPPPARDPPASGAGCSVSGLAGDHLQKRRAVAVQLLRADAGDAGHLVQRSRAASRPSRSGCGRGRRHRPARAAPRASARRLRLQQRQKRRVLLGDLAADDRSRSPACPIVSRRKVTVASPRRTGRAASVIRRAP